MDECAVNNGGCSDYANCTNMLRNYTCNCVEGYIGDAFNCAGNIKHVLKLSCSFDQ